MAIPFVRTARAFCLALVAFYAPALAADRTPAIAAASDLQFAVTELAEAFHSETGDSVRLSFGSTGNFARQIREGAPFEMFMAADERFITDLNRDGLTRDEGALYALGRLVMIVPDGSALGPEGTLDTLADALGNGKVRRFAIANPDHAPYGMRARDALKTNGIWQDIQPHLVLGENVSQAAQFALSGNADGGIIAYSLALAPEITRRGRFALIPEEWHTPLRQRMALMNEAGPVAEAFYDFMKTEAAREIMARYGFSLPQE